MSVAGVVVGALLLWASTGTLHAEPLAVKRPVSVAVAPDSFRVYGPIEDQDFDYGLGEAFRDGIHRYVANHDAIFESISPEEVRAAYRRQPRFEGTVSAAKEWAEHGLDSYKQLRSEKAIEQLENAVERYAKIDYAVVDSEAVAQVLMYLALSYLNEGNNAARPLTLMKRLVRLDPSRALRRGFYPDRIATFYRSARRDLIRRLMESGPASSRGRRMLELTGAKFALFGAAFQTDDGYRAELYVYSGPEEEFLETESIRIDEPTRAKVRAAANRMMSRLAPCFRERDRRTKSRTVVKSTGEGPFAMHLTFAYASFLEYPDAIDKPFGNAGAGVGANLALTDEFGVGVGVQMLSSIRNFSGSIIGNFSTLRVFGGPDLGIDVGRFNFGLSFAAEGTNIGELKICRTEDRPPEVCPDDALAAEEDLSLLMGLNARPRIRYRLIESFEVVAAGSFSMYLLPADRPLNNPLAGEFGLRYRF